ncbi:MAG: hypothetical protein A2W31_13945 [Planctomycetes bacterium RBG_16_64_10]|nr:MAG: hypothetical protein A2W31_13945 [Planctomycetes bacterium RBG_16_64_10]
MAGAAERPVTDDHRWNHVLDNNDNFSPDDRFLVFDTRPAGDAIAASSMIGKVELATGKITPLYEPAGPGRFGPGVGAATFAHQRDEVLFIHGPFRPTGAENQYALFRRIGVMAAGDGSGKIRFADARNTRPPFTVGALRGGTHRHELSGDGQWIGFTYNDAVVRAYGLKTGRDLDLRTIGVTQLEHRVDVPRSEQFPDHGEGFSVLVVTVSAEPAPGSDEISRAADDSWVGRDGYVRPDGRRQRARAFIGTTRDRAGHKLDELFVVDIPPDITRPGPAGPLEGTEQTLPMPPAGTVQRRLTDSSGRKFPGCAGIVRCAHDGQSIAFRMHDDAGQWQMFLASPDGGPIRQATAIEGGVDTGARWHPSGHAIACVAGTRIIATVVKPGALFGRCYTLSDRGPAPFGLVWSHDGKTIAYNRTVETDGQLVTQIFVIDYPDADGDGIPDGS